MDSTSKAIKYVKALPVVRYSQCVMRTQYVCGGKNAYVTPAK